MALIVAVAPLFILNLIPKGIYHKQRRCKKEDGNGRGGDGLTNGRGANAAFVSISVSHHH
ncbi:hypothetical protein NC651_018149 [Populus alba x Populus x berolinensis]|nr:hypothetical protein NC651_018149 [Populus alba x Populus x berolinensis]